MCNILLSLFFGISVTSCARILGIVPTSSYSHQIVFRPLWKQLLLKGHQVTLITTDPMNDTSLTNLTEIDVHFSYKTWNDKFNMVELNKLSAIGLFNHLAEAGETFSEEQLQHPEVQRFFNNDTEKYDLVLVQTLFPAMSTFAKKFNCPLIQIFSLDALSFVFHSLRNPVNPVVNPDYVLNLPKKLNFFQRLTSTFTSLYFDNYYYPNVLRKHQSLVNKYFGYKYPTIEKTLTRTNKIFINTNIILHRVRPLLPNIIQFGGGVHLSASKPIPKDLNELLDKATKGFIYFSLGSNVKSKLLPEHTRKVLLETFVELPYTILWKYEEDNLPGKPDNVIISRWFPQQDIFRHPNIKLFITQGGLQSTEEAIYNYIPIIGMPFVADQKRNVGKLVETGSGLSLDFNTMDKATLKKTILEVINNSSYRRNVNKFGRLAKDRPITGIERAVWFTEYVIRHKGATHLRSPALDLSDYQYYLSDVTVFCLLVVLTTGYTTVKLSKIVLERIN